MNTRNLIRTVCALALLAGARTSGNGQEKMQDKEITVDSIYFSPDFAQKTLTGIGSLMEEKEYHKLEKGILYRCVRQKNGKEKMTVWLNPGSDARFSGNEWQPRHFAFNAAKDRVLLLSDVKSVYRRSARCRAVVWTLGKDGKFTDPVMLSQDGPVQEACFSPDGNKVSYIRQNNLYYYDLVGKVEIAVTVDGEENVIRNGHADWVYEEEFGITKAYDWNPDSRSIAYLKFDESAVKEYDMTVWGDGLYPTPCLYKYPKAGEENSKVSLWRYDLVSRTRSPFRFDADSVEYVPRVFWNPTGSELIFYTLNRHQDHFRIWGVDGNGKSRVIYEERNAAYVDVHDDIYFFKDGRRFLMATGKDGYNHLYLFDGSGDDKGFLLTPGQYDVTRLYGVDEANGRVFFQAAYTSPADRDLMCVGLDGRNLRRPALDLQLKGGGTYAFFNDDFTYMVVEHSKADCPASYYLYHIGPQDEQLVRCLLSNSHIEETAKRHSFVKKEFFRIPVPLTGMGANAFMDARFFGTHRQEQKGGKEKKGSNPRQVYLQAWMMKPAEAGTDEAQGKRYPVLMFLYGGPGSQQVMNELRPYQTADYAWYQMLVRKGYVVVCVDNRGTGGRGEAFKKCTYLQLGKYETQDQIAAARHIGGLPYVDSSRIGIWGWSYGGFMSSNCLFQGNGVFKAAMAVAPVTNWKYYDNVYTERFMRTPAENPDGYELNSPVHHAGKLQGDYLLVHGTADDNVHFQNSVDLVTALQKAGKQFRFMMYPDKNHGMGGNEGSSRPHLYHLLTRFILENL